MVHFLLMWCGGSRLEDNKVLSCVEYMKMNATTAHGIVKKYFYPALVRRYGVISGPYVVQCDGCKCIAKGFERFNEEMGYEAIRVIFRGRDENDPKAPGRLCDFWPTESLWGWIKQHLTKRVSKDATFKKGVGFSLTKGTPKYAREMKKWARFVRALIVKIPPRVMQGVYRSIPRRRDRIIAANGGAIGS